ncbi:TIGR02757 family protein [Spongiivirga citrea]|uniref:TIGR02757 family protein n=1 Tax=Spongiivirga citrea TaxID=1481457 RepID=A0A6M0CF94_9FLAO|nr:TIGR02757 family protein [Spongiivirga citrea]NER16506.1 TIGR02757 family protein [Spongiivirga citrea]
MNKAELKEFLDEKASFYEHPKFIEDDPIQIPHQFTLKEDKEISAFLTATISWGNRKSIIKSATRMMEVLDNSPYDFVMNHQESDLDSLKSFVHRTFNGDDLGQFIKSLQHIYTQQAGLEHIFSKAENGKNIQDRIHHFKKTFFDIPHLERTKKHVSDPHRGSAAKRINMFLRWMVRSKAAGVDFGLWHNISPSLLSCPLDVHSGNVARKLGLVKRKQNDAKALLELDKSLRKLDPTDPVKYDFALFGLGVFEKF